MTSKEGVVWCWKEKAEDILFIFRDSSQEIEINLRNIKNNNWFVTNDKLLLPDEKDFIRSIVSQY